MLNQQDRTQRTYRLELQRAVASGILESAAQTFLILIAISWFHAPRTAKGFLASGIYGGLLFTPALVSFVSRRGWRPTAAAARIALIGAIVFLITLLIPRLEIFILAGMIANACATTPTPLMTQVYQENYPYHCRGQLYSRTVAVRIATVALAGWIGGRLLEWDFRLYRLLLLLWILAFLHAANCYRRIPSSPLRNDTQAHPFQALRYVLHHPLFRTTLLSWMIMGFGNLMMLPLRVEYLANPKYHLTFSPEEVALLVSVLPSLVRLVATQLWGWLFDHINFFLLRILLNLCFAAATITFFFSRTPLGFYIGAILYGLSSGGGDVAWGLWVTRFAPPSRTAIIMAVHTFLTGTRGLIAPHVGFQLAGILSIHTLALIGTGMILFAAVLLIPLIPVDQQYAHHSERGTVSED